MTSPHVELSSWVTRGLLYSGTAFQCKSFWSQLSIYDQLNSHHNHDHHYLNDAPPRKVTKIGWLAAGCSKRRRSAARKSPLSYHPAGSNRFQDHHLAFQYHDVPNSSSDLLLDNKQTPLIFSSEYIFNSHYMFRRSGPGHMLLHTDFQGKLINEKNMKWLPIKYKCL